MRRPSARCARRKARRPRLRRTVARSEPFTRAIARAAADAGVMYTPHTWGDGLVLLANLHVAAACSNAPFVEYAFDPPWWTPERRDFMLPAPVVADHGWVDLGDAPGLGVEINWDALERWRLR